MKLQIPKIGIMMTDLKRLDYLGLEVSDKVGQITTTIDRYRIRCYFQSIHFRHRLYVRDLDDTQEIINSLMDLIISMSISLEDNWSKIQNTLDKIADIIGDKNKILKQINQTLDLEKDNTQSLKNLDYINHKIEDYRKIILNIDLSKILSKDEIRELIHQLRLREPKDIERQTLANLEKLEAEAQKMSLQRQQDSEEFRKRMSLIHTKIDILENLTKKLFGI